MKVLNKLLCLIIIIGLSLSPYLAMAQIDPGCNPDESCPIDSNVYILVIAALLFAAYKYYSKYRLSKVN